MTAPDNRNEAVQFLYRHSDLTYSASMSVVEKLSNNGFRIVRADLHDTTKTQLAECEARLRKTVGILRDMVCIAELDRWNRALTGREMILRDARAVLADIEKGGA